jgi:hypothetical protein
MSEVGSVCMYVREIDVYSFSFALPSLAELVNLPLSARVVSSELYAPGVCCAGRRSDHRIVHSLHMYKKSLRKWQEIQRGLMEDIMVERREVEG